MDWLWGHTGHSLLDYWTLAHIAFWFFMGSTLAAVRFNRPIAFCLCLCSAFWWEVFERFAEPRWPTIWLSPESWWNAWGSDLLTTLFVLVAYHGYDYWRPK